MQIFTGFSLLPRIVVVKELIDNARRLFVRRHRGSKTEGRGHIAAAADI